MAKGDILVNRRLKFYINELQQKNNTIKYVK